MKFLIFGDVVGRAGREAVSRVLPELRATYAPDSIIVNIENSAHGNGVSPTVLNDTKVWQADVFTTGDHAWDNRAGIPLLNKSTVPILRPANYPPGVPGRGYTVYTKGAVSVAVINLQGQVAMKNHPANPFFALDELLRLPEIAAAQIKLIDFHAETTSEKRAFGWHVDGRVSAVWGTHTHIPTADAQILPRGTGYVSDVGMNGNYHSIIGVETASSLQRFLQQIPVKLNVEEDTGSLEIGALFLDIDASSGQTITIAHIRKIMND